MAKEVEVCIVEAAAEVWTHVHHQLCLQVLLPDRERRSLQLTRDFRKELRLAYDTAILVCNLQFGKYALPIHARRLRIQPVDAEFMIHVVRVAHLHACHRCSGQRFFELVFIGCIFFRSSAVGAHHHH